MMSASSDRIDVLLAACNGAPFLEEQLESILHQEHAGLRILARDDASTDGTDLLLRQWAARWPGRIVLVGGRGEGGRLGACGNFAALVEAAEADYVMFSDQDDVWLPGKVAKTLRRMKEVEARAGPECPALVHSDLAVVDESLRPLGRSFWAYQNFSPRRGAVFNRLLVQNVVTGCAAMINRALARKARPIPPEAVMHDWWLALVAAAFGRLECLGEPTVLYRQHGGNRIGAARWNLAHVVRKLATVLDRSPVIEGLRASQRQAGALVERFGPELPARHRAAAAAYTGLLDCNFLGRRWRLARYGFFRSGWLRNLSLFARV